MSSAPWVIDSGRPFRGRQWISDPKRPPANGDADRLSPRPGDDQKSRRAPVLTDINEDVDELKTKIAALVRETYGGDYRKAFAHYDPDQDGIAAEELKQAAGGRRHRERLHAQRLGLGNL